MKKGSNEETAYVPDQWDSVFEEFDHEEDLKEEQIRQEERVRQQETTGLIRQMLDQLGEILAKGPRNGMCREVKRFFGGGKKGFSKGDPNIFRQRTDCIKNTAFQEGIRELCETYVIDKSTYEYLLGRVFTKNLNRNVDDMRIYLLGKWREAPFRTMRKISYPVIIAMLALIYGCQVVVGTHPFLAVFPVVMVGLHWFIYRKYHDEFGGPCVNTVVSVVGFPAFSYMTNHLEPAGYDVSGLRACAIVYLYIFIIAMCLWVGQRKIKRMKD